MTDEEAFLRTICNNPDDDLPRLAFADWLMERGKWERAEFIRKQCELAKLPEYDPLWIRCWNQERHWITGYQMALDSIPPTAGVVDKAPFCYRRGFVWKLRVLRLADFLALAPGYFDLAPIQCLDVDARDRPDLGPFAACEWVRKLTALEWTLGYFGAEPIGAFVDSPNVENITDLTFQFAGILGDGLFRLLTSPFARNLRTLKLRSNSSSEYGRSIGVALAAARTLPALESLELPENRLAASAFRQIATQCELPRLTTLDLAGAHLGSEGVRLLGTKPGFALLKVLNLAGTNPAIPGIRALTESPHLGNLRSLNLAQNRLGPVAARAIAACPNFGELRLLDLGNNPLKDNGVRAIAAAPVLSKLVSLRLANTECGDAGARAILESSTLVNLVHLDLYGNEIGEPLRLALKERFGPRLFGVR
jgi:uncharacterized protein (TIGR02996 family)